LVIINTCILYKAHNYFSSDQVPFNNYPFISYMVYYHIILIEFVLSFFADAEPRKSDYGPIQVHFPTYIRIYQLFIQISVRLPNQFLGAMSWDESVIPIEGIIFMVWLICLVWLQAPHRIQRFMEYELWQ